MKKSGDCEKGLGGREGCWDRGFDCFLTALMYLGPGGSTRPEEWTDEKISDEQKSQLESLKQEQAAETRGGFGSWLGCH